MAQIVVKLVNFITLLQLQAVPEVIKFEVGWNQDRERKEWIRAENQNCPWH